MYRIARIEKFGRFTFHCKQISDLNMYYSVTFVDDSNDSKIVAFFSNPCPFDRKSFLSYLKKEYGITEISGVGKEFIYVFDEYDLELLDFLDWNGYSKNYSVNTDDSLYDCDNSNHLAYISKGAFVTLTDILTEIQGSYKIEDNILTVFADKFPTYIISDVTRFNRLLTKLIVLRGKDVQGS